MIRSLFVSLLFFASLSFIAGAPAIAPAETAISGKILETMSGAGYTYVNLETKDGPRWAALPETKVAVGEEISITPGMEMKDFFSKTFNRTFATIIFSPGLAGASVNDQTPAATAPASKPEKNSFEAAVAAEQQQSPSQPPPDLKESAGSMGAIAPFAETKVEKAEGPNSYTVAEIFERSKELNGKTVRVRGQVVKYNPNIMGKNWIHLQDGTGDPLKNTHDLVVTTTEQLGSPAVIVVEGVLAADKDFGAGYKYAVIVEDAKLIQ